MHPWKYIATLFIVICLTYSQYLLADDTDNESILITTMLKDVDDMHQQFSQTFFRTLLKQPQYQSAKFPSLPALQKELDKAPTQVVHNSALIVNNLAMIKSYYDDPTYFNYVEKLLAVNEFNAANQLLNHIIEQGYDGLTARANYLLATYYFKREQWSDVQALLSKDSNLLAPENHQHALLMAGIALQQQGEHYKAIKIYEKIPASSSHYTAAQLNLAIANLRQGWWTDGHIIIKDLLKAQQKRPQEKTLNRLYITLAYSLLNQGYYRTARNTFHQVGINSRYANQAILGIALTAAQQDDDIGALNATRFLKNRPQDDLPVHESHLLMPFFYEKSHQLVPASVGYSEASDYYQQKIKTINQALKSSFEIADLRINKNDSRRVSIAGNEVNLSTHYPDYFFANYNAISTFSNETQQIQQPALTKKLQSLSQAYAKLASKMSKKILSQRASHLTSYLNQSRYGLARLFDNNTQ
ncbi:hypothetical protein CW745_01120 [Psychromonas sp. psych-6C06]|nr:hypothetical protein CW745_01120 [Psychromonas sp. psych-6C06]